jgi:hypothetical protein
VEYASKRQPTPSMQQVRGEASLRGGPGATAAGCWRPRRGQVGGHEMAAAVAVMLVGAGALGGVSRVSGDLPSSRACSFDGSERIRKPSREDFT